VDKTYTLILPTNRLTDYIVNRDSIFAKDSLYLGDYLNPSTMAKKLADTEVIYHKVKSGETLGAIARKYRVTTKQLMKWNNLKNADKLRIGQRIRIER
jgi:membrane-bound lytic murein transglycosylase D